jgi:RNA polymerase sigma factor (sigma-70 family)
MNAAPRTSDELGDKPPLADPPEGLDRDPADSDAGLADGWDEPPPDADPQPARAGERAASEIQLAAWIEAIADRDERALAALYDATFSRVFGLVWRIVRNTATAEEVVEDTFFQVWRQAVRFDPERGKPITWLLAMARSRAIDALRHEARFQHDPLNEDSAAEVASGAVPVDELLDLARHRSDLHQALMLLGAQPRQLVSMAFFRGLSHEEIAEQAQLPLGTVKSQIRRALLSLRQILGAGGAPALA